jgi:acyl-CoA synthetase (AMP-forming)/AMP-acid ligase II
MSSSHLRGPPALVCPWASLAAALEARRGAWLVFHRGKDTPLELDGPAALELARRWATSLAEAGVKPGDRVGVLQPNSPDFIGAYFGASMLGAAAVPLPWPVVEGAPERTRDDSVHVLNRAQLKVLATTPAMAACAWPVPLLTAPAERAQFTRAPDDGAAPAFIQFTSGSTGTPRGAVLSHQAALASAMAMGVTLGLGPSDVGVSWIPFFHDMGLVGVVLCSLVTGFSVNVLRPAEFLLRPSRWFELVSRTRASITVGPNFGYDLAARRGANVPGLDLSGLKLALNGSEPIHRATLDSVAKAFGPMGYAAQAMAPVYGLAEATLGVTFALGDGAGPDFKFGERHVICCGTPLAGMEVKLVRDGATVPLGHEGEVCVRGPSLMTGYYDDPEATSAALREGWLHTGDLGVMHEGRLHLTGREKELIIKSGRKFHPYDIERVVSETVETTPNGVAAFSRPDDRAGTEELIIVVELRRISAAAEATDTVRARLMDRLGVRADRIEFVPAGELPRTTSGKVKRRECVTRFGGGQA